MDTFTNLSVTRTTNYGVAYSDKSIYHFEEENISEEETIPADKFQIGIVAIFDQFEPYTMVNYSCILQYLDPNSASWVSQATFRIGFQHPKDNLYVQSPLFTLSNVYSSHRKAGTRYRFEVIISTANEVYGVYYTDCLFVPPVLSTMDNTYNWISGTPWVYCEGQWKKAKSVFVYHDNHWKESILGYPQT